MFVAYEAEAVETSMYTPLRDLMRPAYQFAYDNSTDTSTKVGALLVTEHCEVVTWGVNAHTNSAQLKDARNFERPRKYKVTEHAERASIYQAARKGIATEGLMMVCPWACCPDCARAIVLAGITQVYAHKAAFDMTPPRWREEVELGVEILEGSGVRYHLYEGTIDKFKNLFDG